MLQRLVDDAKVARLAAKYLRALVWVRVRRRVKGPMRRGWSERFEALVEMLKRDTDAMRGLTAAEIRNRMENPVRPRSHERVRIERASGAPVTSTWIVPKKVEPRGAMLYLHGGGYVCGSPSTHLPFLSRLAHRARLSVLAVDYRLAPEHPFPHAIDDAVASFRWLATQHAPERIVVAGDSAGGGLTVSTLLSLRDEEHVLPAGAILLSPWVDLGVTHASIAHNARFDWIDERFLHRCAREYLGEADRNHPHASPIHANLRKLPPILILAGGAEILLDESRTLAERAKAAGVDVTLEVADDMVHVWPLFADLVPEGKVAIDRIARFVDDVLAR